MHIDVRFTSLSVIKDLNITLKWYSFMVILYFVDCEPNVDQRDPNSITLRGHNNRPIPTFPILSSPSQLFLIPKTVGKR